MAIRTQSIRDWRRDFGVVSAVAKECISFMLWEQQKYTSGTTTQQVFFQQSTTGFAGNLSAGQLPNGNSFLVQALRIHPALDAFQNEFASGAAGPAAGPIQDIIDLTREGTATLKVGDKLYGRWPIFCLPSGAGPWGFVTLTGAAAANALDTSEFATNGVPDVRNVYTFPIPVTLPPQYPFTVTLDWNGAQTLTVGDSPIFVMLDGQLIRPVQ